MKKLVSNKLVGVILAIFLILVIFSILVIPLSPIHITLPSVQLTNKTIGETEGNFQITKINPDSVEGLSYMEYPIARLPGQPTTLYVGDTVGYACNGSLAKIVKINSQSRTVTFQNITNGPSKYGCPICLASNTLISTPNGDIKVTDLKVGMPVYSQDKNGNKVIAHIIRLSNMEVPKDFQIIHIKLLDGREAYISSPHPTINGLTIGQLKVGDIYDNSKIVELEPHSYWDNKTYDLLSDSDTGFYWANGILVGSTLKKE